MDEGRAQLQSLARRRSLQSGHINDVVLAALALPHLRQSLLLSLLQTLAPMKVVRHRQSPPSLLDRFRGSPRPAPDLSHDPFQGIFIRYERFGAFGPATPSRCGVCCGHPGREAPGARVCGQAVVRRWAERSSLLVGRLFRLSRMRCARGSVGIVLSRRLPIIAIHPNEGEG